jgi:hypothetical protein
MVCIVICNVINFVLAINENQFTMHLEYMSLVLSRTDLSSFCFVPRVCIGIRFELWMLDMPIFGYLSRQ